MSLKNFHLFFITVATITALCFGLWCFFTKEGTAQAGSTIMGAFSLLAVPVLVVYACKIIRKLDRAKIE